MTNLKITDNQTKVMRTLAEHGSFISVDREDCLDLDALVEAVPYDVTKASLQFTLRGLKSRGYLEKRGMVFRRGKQRVTWSLTKSGENYILRSI